MCQFLLRISSSLLRLLYPAIFAAFYLLLSFLPTTSFAQALQSNQGNQTNYFDPESSALWDIGAKNMPNIY